MKDYPGAPGDQQRCNSPNHGPKTCWGELRICPGCGVLCCMADGAGDAADTARPGICDTCATEPRRRALPGEGLLVAAKQCDQCLFSKGKIVSDVRRDELLVELERRDTHFTCHKATLQHREAVCRGDYNRDPIRTQGMQIAYRLDCVVFVDENGFVVSDTRSDHERAVAGRRPSIVLDRNTSRA